MSARMNLKTSKSLLAAVSCGLYAKWHGWYSYSDCVRRGLDPNGCPMDYLSAVDYGREAVFRDDGSARVIRSTFNVDVEDPSVLAAIGQTRTDIERILFCVPGMNKAVADQMIDAMA